MAIVGTESINGCFGADFYCYNQGASAWSSNDSNASEQQSIYRFMTSDSGLKMSMSAPNASGYLGTSVTVYDYTTNGIDYDYEVPTTMVESGLTYNTTFAGIGKERLTTYINNNTTFKSTLASKGYYDNNKL